MECKKTVREYWYENNLEQELNRLIKNIAESCFDSVFLRGHISPEVVLSVSEKNSVFGRSSFCIKAEIVGKYVMDKTLYEYMDYKTDKADAYGAAKVIDSELAEIASRREILARKANQSAESFIRGKLSSIVFSDFRTLQVFTNVNFDLSVLESILKICKSVLK